MSSQEAILDKRRAGILLSITALPDANYSFHEHHGDFSQALAFIDFLYDAGISVWQLLPLGPTHQDNSPYQCLSAHAGNPDLISLHWLAEQAYLQAGEFSGENHKAKDKHDYLQQAFAAFKQRSSLASDYQQFVDGQAFWLDDFALFMAIRDTQERRHWIDWPEALRDRHSQAMQTAKINLADSIEQIKFEQYIFTQQWQKIKTYASLKQVLLFGDVPLFVAHDSVDVWKNREQFTVDTQGRAELVSGVPPDYFSEQGQRWGNPLYRWELMQGTHFQWWTERIATELQRFDLVRIDHFRGLAASWAIPAQCETAIDGSWLPVPGYELLQHLKNYFKHLPFIAEDLGIITQDVEHLRDHFQFPGMKILQFAFDSGPDNPYLPNQHIENCVVYTGTHDNNTTLGWYQSLDYSQQQYIDHFLETELAEKNTLPKQALSEKEMPWPLIHCALASVAKLAIIPMQDILELGEGNRTNTPGTTKNNWQWRFHWSDIKPSLSIYLSAQLNFYKRVEQ